MCGRFTLTATPEALTDLFGLADSPVLQKIAPRYNVAPTQPVAVVRVHADGKRRLDVLRWGLIPVWSKDPSGGAPLINARAETVAEKPAFRSAFKRRRCIIPANGFYEWRAEGKRKQPYYVHMADEQLFGMAGLWEYWQGPQGDEVESCTILTTTANDLIRPLHERMTVILPPDAYELWLDPAVQDTGLLQSLLQPFPPEKMAFRAVSDYVSSSRNEGAECLAPAEGAAG